MSDFVAIFAKNLNELIDKFLFSKIINITCIKTVFINSMVFSVGPISYLHLLVLIFNHFILMKLITLMVI